MSRRIPVLQKGKPAFSEMTLQRNISQYDEHKSVGTNERKTGIYITATEYRIFTSGKLASFYNTNLLSESFVYRLMRNRFALKEY